MTRKGNSKPFCIAIAAALLVGSRAAQAGERIEHVNVKAGVPTLILTFANCNDHHPFYGTAFVEHGTVSYKDITFNYCSNPNELGRQMWYTPNPGYYGADVISFPRALEINVTVY